MAVPQRDGVHHFLHAGGVKDLKGSVVERQMQEAYGQQNRARSKPLKPN